MFGTVRCGYSIGVVKPSNSEAYKKSCYSFIKVKTFKICIRSRKFGIRLDSFKNIYVNSYKDNFSVCLDFI